MNKEQCKKRTGFRFSHSSCQKLEKLRSLQREAQFQQPSDFSFLGPVRRLPWWLNGKESTCQCKRLRFNPWVRKIPWRRKWQPTPVFLLRNGQRSLVGYSPWGHKSWTWHQISSNNDLFLDPEVQTLQSYTIAIVQFQQDIRLWCMNQDPKDSKDVTTIFSRDSSPN